MKNNLNYFKKYSSYTEEVNTNKNVWFYSRVSSKSQFDTNSSIDNQRTAASRYAYKNQLSITDNFGGTYESAKGDFTRKEFKRLISEVKKAKNKPYAILIYKMSRFSRTGANAIGLVSELINTHKVHLIEVCSGKDTTTPRGEHEIIESLQYARKENIERLEITIPGLTSYVRNGNWLGTAPRGYDHYGPRVKNAEFISGKQRLEINEEGKLIKKAWKWKAQGVADYKIREKLSTYGLAISKQSLSAMWRNPFYCGIQANKLLKGEVVEGSWKPLVSKEQFQKINEILDSKTSTGYTQSKTNDGRPLQSHLFCGICGTKMTGYKAKKKYDYYKCQNKSCNCKDLNANSSTKSIKKGINNLFEDYLNQFVLDTKYTEAFKAQMKLTINDRNNESIQLETSLNSQLENLNIQLDSLERKYAFEELDVNLYKKFRDEIEYKIGEKNREKSNLSLKISNLDKKIEKCVNVTQNISKYWRSSKTDDKIRMQKLIFPHGIVIDPIKRQYRTTEINSVFSLISSISRESEDKKKDSSTNLVNESHSVAGTGLEPVTFGL
ncbi:recombinase family protein [Psychroflexus sp. CAK1W]|uniref:recombinase family protein n=1 Tax=Psychroflexus curvus TaxID=2873595 RepID=UPI001CCE7662|nr:recombinase family protein [Psychroflexus curvus]MBZ9628148.1 recombinase family protein [Psychroflexus curvus]